MTSSTLLVVAAVMFPVALTLDRWLSLEVAGANLYLTDVIVVLGFARFFASWIAGTGAVRRSGHFAPVLLLCLAVVQGISSLRTDAPMSAWFRMLSQYAVFWVLLFGFDRRFSHATCESLIYYGLLTVPVTVIFEALLTVLGFPIGYAWFGNYEETVRYVGIAGDTAQASMLCLLISSIALFRLFGTASTLSSTDVAILLVSLVGNVLTGTRGSLVCLLATFFLFCAINFRTIRATRFLVIVSLALMSAALIGYTLQGSLLAVSRFFEGDPEVIGAQRIVPMIQAFDLAFEHPILGVGFGNSYTLLRTFVSNELGFVGSFNQYLHSFLETGIVGGLLTVAFLLTLVLELRRGAQVDRHTALVQGAYLWVLVLVVAYQTEAWISPGSRISMVFFAVSAVSLRLTRAPVGRANWAASPMPIGART